MRNGGENPQVEPEKKTLSPIEESNETTNINPAVLELMHRFNQAAEAGETVDIDDLCGQFPGPPEEARRVLTAMQAAEARLKAVTPKPARAPELEKEIAGSSVTTAARFTRLRLHAKGGLGIVFKAYDEELGREVAIKILAENQGLYYEDCRVRFLRESEVMGRLRHPGIVPVLSRGETLDGRPFYVMPFLEEGSFDKAINQFHEDHPSYRPRDPQFRDLLTRFTAACNTVAYAHSRGVVHRDLKPHNIMLGRYGETLVIDWGLAERSRRADAHRLTGEQSIVIRGSSGNSSSSGGFTPQYASPEQLDGTLAVGPPSDVYSLGAILYKLICGVPPLTATTLGEMRQSGLKGEFPPPGERKHCAPKPLESICLKAMQLDPEQRYASPELLALDVEAYLADAPVSAHKEDALGRSARIVRRHWPMVLAMMAALLVVTLISFAWAFNQQGLRKHAREASISRLQLATNLAAQACGAEIDRRWRLLELEAASPTLISAVEQLNADKTNREVREKLQAHLTEQYVNAHHVQGIKLLSMFIGGEDGELVARVPRSDSIGKNFAFRDYFHGRHMDLPEDSSPKPAKLPVLSVVYISKSTEDPNVALSVPLWGQSEEGERKVIGRLGMAIAVGDLGMFDQLGNEAVPMLVETRNYSWDGEQSYGLVVQHPDFQTHQADAMGTAIPLPRVAMETTDKLVAEWKRNITRQAAKESSLLMADFVEPMSHRKTEAAFAKVMVPGRDNEVNDTGWFIVLHPRPSSE